MAQVSGTHHLSRQCSVFLHYIQMEWIEIKTVVLTRQSSSPITFHKVLDDSYYDEEIIA